MKLSIGIPCYNEEEVLPLLAEELKQILPILQETYSLEVLFIDDGSQDETFSLMKHFFGDWPFARFLQHSHNKGIGQAVRTGIQNATGDYYFHLDADCTYPLDLMPAMLEDLNHFDIVLASPFNPKGKVIGLSKFRLFLSQTISLFYKFITGTKITSFTSYFRAYRMQVLRAINFKSNDFASTAEILIIGLANGARVKEVPSTLSQRKFGKSKMNFLKAVWGHILLTFKIFKIKLNRKLEIIHQNES